MKKYSIFIFIIVIFIGIIISGIFFSQKYILKSAVESLNENARIVSETDMIRGLDATNGIDTASYEEENEPIIVELEKKEDITINMSAIGDIMCHNSQYKDAYKNGRYDFSYVFEDIKPYIENADVSIGNLETTFAGKEKGYNSYPNFNTPEALAEDLKELGIDVLSTANNHSLDTGYKGIESTIDYLDTVGISHTGTYKSIESQNEILIKEINGLKIAFLAYTYGTNGIALPSGREYCINLIDKDLIKRQLDLAKEGNPDIICVNMHWGEEYQARPNNEQLDLEKFLFENGVDIILGSHPHVLQPMEVKEFTMPDGNKKNVFTIYSLGNFMSGQDKKNTRNSIILNMDIIKESESGKLRFEKVNYIPIYTYTSPKYKNYKVLDLQKAISSYENGNPHNYTKTEYDLFRSELESVNLNITF